MAYLHEDDFKFPKDSFRSMKYQPYELKPSFSMYRVYQWHKYWDGDVYVSFSGGADSTVLAYIVCEAYRKYGLHGKIPLVFSNTGMEFPEIQTFVIRYTEWLKNKFPELDIELEIIRPKQTFKQVCESKGYPIISKETAAKIRKLRKGNLSFRYRNYLLNGDERGKYGMLAKKWQYLADKDQIAEDISEECCNILKKEPFRRYVKKTGRYPFIGITQDESFMRENQYNHTGCNVYDGKTIKSQPIGFWPKQEIMQYIHDKSIPICEVYGELIKDEHGNWRFTKEQRTGCVICGFGCHLEEEPNRIQRLAASENEAHRKIYAWGMEIKNNGVTYREALGHCGIKTEFRGEGGVKAVKFYRAIKGTDLYERNGAGLIPDDIVVGMNNTERRQVEEISVEELAEIYNDMDYFDPDIFQALIEMSGLEIPNEEIESDRDAVIKKVGEVLGISLC